MKKKMSFFALCAMILGLTAFTSCEPGVEPIKDSYPRKMILIEQFTGMDCPNCPQGTTALKAAITGMTNPERVCWVAHHAGYRSDKFTISENTELATYLGIKGAPSAVAERKACSVNGSLSFNWHPAYATTLMLDGIYAAGSPTTVDISIERTYDEATGKLTVTVSGVSLDDDVKISALIVQSNMKASQAGASGTYTHNHAPRHFFTPALGESLTLEDKRFSVTYTYDVPAKIKNIPVVIEDMEIVAYVATNGTSAFKSTILNCDRVSIK